MYIDLQRNTRTRRDRKALARKLQRDLVRTGYKNPEMAAWDVARGVVRTMRRLNQHWYRSNLGFMCQEDSTAARLYIRHRYRRVLQRLDTIEEPDLSLPIDAIEGEYVVIHRGKNRGKGPERHEFKPMTDPHFAKGPYAPSEALEKSIRWQADDGVVRRVVGAVSGDSAVLMQIRVDGVMLPLLKMSPHGLAVIPSGPKGHIPPDVFLAEEVQEHPAGHVVTTYVKPLIVNESPKTLHLGTIDHNAPFEAAPIKVNTSDVPFCTASPEEKRPALTSLHASGVHVAELPDGTRVITKHPDHVPGVGAGYTIQKVEHLEGGGIHVTHEKPDGTVFPVGELFFPTIIVGPKVPPAPPTMLLGEIDKTTRLPNGTIYRGEPNVMVPPEGTAKDPNVLPPGLPYPTPQKLIHPAAVEAMESRESKPGKIKVNGKYVRVVQRVEGGIVNLYKVNDDGSKEPLTGVLD